MSCPRCKVFQPLHSGEAQHCFACGAPLIVSERDARRAQHRARRALGLQKGAPETPWWRPSLITAAISTGGAVLFMVLSVISNWTGGDGESLWDGAASLWSFGYLVALGLALPYFSVSHLRKKFDPLVHRFAGRIHRKETERAEWLHRHWPDVDLIGLHTGALLSASFDVHGLPGAIECRPVAGIGRIGTGYAMISVDCPTDMTQRLVDPSLTELAGALRRAGFELGVCDGGLIATAGKGTLTELLKGQRPLTVFTDALDILARVAHHTRCRPHHIS